MENGRRVTFDSTKDIQSPRFRAIIRATSGRRRRATDIKSFSHELNGNGPRHRPISKLSGLGSTEEFLKAIRMKFNRLKKDVDSELAIYAGDLVGFLEKSMKEHPEWRVPIEDLLVTSQQCAEMSPDDFWEKCEDIVQNLDDRRQELPTGPLKQVHTRILFILTRCTRLLNFQKEGVYDGDHFLGFHQFSDLGVYPTNSGRMLKSLLSSGDFKERLMRRRIHEHEISASGSPSRRSRISSWKKLPSAAEKNQKKENKYDGAPSREVLESFLRADQVIVGLNDNTGILDVSSKILDKPIDPSLEGQEAPGAEHETSDGKMKMICRICDFEIPTVNAESHFGVCTFADRCDMKGLSVDQRLERVADILEKILECWLSKCSDNAATCLEDGRASTSTTTEESDLTADQNILSCPPSTNAVEYIAEAIGSATTRDINDIPSMWLNTNSTTLDQGLMVLSSGSATPNSPLPTPDSSQINFLLSGACALSEHENAQQIQSLLNIVRNIISVTSIDYSSLEYLSSYLEDLNNVIDNRKVDALVVETFGRRIEVLLQEKFVHLCGQIDDGYNDSPYLMHDDDGSLETDSSCSSKTSGRKLKDRTSIEDFEIIKPISRGAFGRVFLAKKRITGDFFAIKVLKKADMIRKNAVESTLAERNILISVRNPFVVRFFYSFTCKENLYLVMEYLNGGDLYSLLRNLGCLDEEMARTYIAELVLALEYLHSVNVIHRDLKPDNLLISCDGHIKLTDFGLSKVGLINSTDDLSGPDVSSSILAGDHEPMPASIRAEKRDQRQKQSAIGTPDYLAPEILLGMQHGPTADWWSVGIILYELLVGIPPFNAEHPQKIFDNIMNRDIPWPKVPEEMSYEAHDVIDKLLMENPVQRLGATGAGEVKRHPFFANVNWDMLSRKKATFIPSPDGNDDTSYFACRHTWNATDDLIHAPPNDDDCTTDTSCCSSPPSTDQDEDGDECSQLAGFEGPNLYPTYSFSNFSFKNLSQLASINYDLITKSSKDSSEASHP
ncbi:probable serine/threonine protein kinase IRE [Dioscorea cayenensis subsp. rotundata]|uniref:non-specific serine/threonine protein kinase n=1 Tax=Dioscorea cayennensis subsp. rotundata TaxID=55577 RepID=A0AB40BC06_DIOCR|nr:probable serine/threonine protein kinase IRE [Dioscorea cayenensis subsp. rotundata]